MRERRGMGDAKWRAAIRKILHRQRDAVLGGGKQDRKQEVGDVYALQRVMGYIGFANE